MILRKKFLVWGQISNLGSFRVKFRTSPKVDKLYLKMKLLARAFHKNYSQGQKRSSKVKNREKRP